MILSILNQYKWYAVAVAFLVYSVGVWNVSAGLERADFTKQELQRTELILKNTVSNQELDTAISKAVVDILEGYRKNGK